MNKVMKINRKRKKLSPEKQAKIDYLKRQRSISRQIQIESGIKHRSNVHRDRTKYNRKNKDWKKDME